MQARNLGDPCPNCGGTEYYCAEEVDTLLDYIFPLLEQIRGFALDCFGGPSSLTDCIDLAMDAKAYTLKGEPDGRR